ncbi:lipopolysaccharide-induced tumor necrosis factor-alpha factor homolog [Panonychus citri]|uniref:lipopolysaccharide-induced tumor necrosis factor-alpha factor homolog n=1 Tax=Panonychus citri TaxID=50023 RepID=UPI0023081BE5|nr:lipopolysaccharide-induced tumor necrosis factor-alpha factor homolog [Panonychus citri]
MNSGKFVQPEPRNTFTSYQPPSSHSLVPHPPIPQQSHIGPVVPIGAVSFGPYPQNVFCPTCNQQVLTSTHKKSGVLAWLVSIGCCLFGCICGCCLIPFFSSITLDVEHSCPKCARKLGIYSKI